MEAFWKRHWEQAPDCILERGERVARTDTLVKLAGSLNIPYDELLDGLLWTPSCRAPWRHPRTILRRG